MTLDTYMIKPTNKYNRLCPLKEIKLHGLDTLSGPYQIRINMFMPRTATPFAEVVEKLKFSLAEALELYSPVTGTIKVNEKGELYIAVDTESIQETPFMVASADTPYNGDTEDISPRGSGFLEPFSSILAVKVTQFTCGTIAIGTSFNHQVGDLGSLLDLLKLWAQLNRGESDSFHIPEDWSRTPGRYFTGVLTEEEINSPPSFPPFVRLSQPEGPPPFLLVETVTTKWKFTKSNLAKLKSDFSPQDSTSWISSGDALAALLCGVITRSRQTANIPRLEKRSSLESNVEAVAMAANGRERTPDKSVPEGSYFGNFNLLWSIDVSRDDLSTPDQKAESRIASNIRKNLNIYLSPKAIAQKIAFFEKAQREGALNNIFWAADIILTNWCHFDLESPSLNFGWGKPFYSTNGAGGQFPPGYCLMTLTKDTGDVTVSMSIEKDAGNDLKKDVVLNTYAQLIKN